MPTGRRTSSLCRFCDAASCAATIVPGPRWELALAIMDEMDSSEKFPAGGCVSSGVVAVCEDAAAGPDDATTGTEDAERETCSAIVVLVRSDAQEGTNQRCTICSNRDKCSAMHNCVYECTDITVHKRAQTL